MSDTIERFSNRVEDYVKHRPNYPKEVLDLFVSKMNLQTSSIVASGKYAQTFARRRDHSARFAELLSSTENDR